MHDLTRSITDDLHFDVARLIDEFFDVNIRRAESRFGLGLAARIGIVDFGCGTHRSHAASSATGNRFDHHRALIGKEFMCRFKRCRPVCTGQERHASFFGQCLGFDLVAKQFKRGDIGADKDEACIGAGAREGGVFRKEPVAGMHSVAFGFFGGGDDLRDVEIGGGTVAFERMSIVADTGMERERIIL